MLTLTGCYAQENMFVDEAAGFRAAAKRSHSESADLPEGQRRRVDAEVEEIEEENEDEPGADQDGFAFDPSMFSADMDTFLD